LGVHIVRALNHRNTEVSNFDVAFIIQEQVAWLDVAMNDASAMSVVERFCTLVNDADDFASGQ
jgi:hypothetical protein